MHEKRIHQDGAELETPVRVHHLASTWTTRVYDCGVIHLRQLEQSAIEWQAQPVHRVATLLSQHEERLFSEIKSAHRSNHHGIRFYERRPF
jgi:hypothetical protein